jgi:tetratricopeptide (TPR) repeat protein
MLTGYSAEAVEQLSERHAAWCAALAENSESNLRGSRQLLWLNHLARERDNFRAALTWAVGSSSEAAMSCALRTLGALQRFYVVRGVEEGRAHFRSVLTTAEERLSAAQQEELIETLAKVHNAAGVLALAHGDLPDAREHLTKCLALRRHIGETRGIAATLNNIAIVELEEDNLDAANQCYEESIELWRELGEEGLVATVSANLGVGAMRLGDFERARKLLSESLNYAVEKRDIRSAAVRRFNLGEACCRSGEFRQAEATFRDCLSDFVTLGDSTNIALCVLNLGTTAARNRDYRTASRRIGSAMVWCQAHGMQLTPHWQNEVKENIRIIGESLGAEEAQRLKQASADEFPPLSQLITELLPSGTSSDHYYR